MRHKANSNSRGRSRKIPGDSSAASVGIICRAEQEHTFPDTAREVGVRDQIPEDGVRVEGLISGQDRGRLIDHQREDATANRANLTRYWAVRTGTGLHQIEGR